MTHAFRILRRTWREVVEANGFGVLCIHGVDGKRYTLPVTNVTSGRDERETYAIGTRCERIGGTPGAR